MASPSQAWVALRTAMLDAEPTCKGDPRFTADDSDPEPLARICARCPLFDPCSSLAQTGNNLPIFGVVGGLVRRGSKSTALVKPQTTERWINA